MQQELGSIVVAVRVLAAAAVPAAALAAVAVEAWQQ